MKHIFEHATTRTKQGDIGEAKAIFELTLLGYQVSRTLFDSAKYELIADKDGLLLRVQVKTTNTRNKKYKDGCSYEHKSWIVNLVTTGGNTKNNTRKKPQRGDFDLLFVVSGDERCWFIPFDEIEGKGVISVGAQNSAPKYSEFEITRPSF